MGAGEELKETGERILTALQEPFYMLATEPVVLSISLYLSLLYALIYAFVQSQLLCRALTNCCTLFEPLDSSPSSLQST